MNVWNMCLLILIIWPTSFTTLLQCSRWLQLTEELLKAQLVRQEGPVYSLYSGGKETSVINNSFLKLGIVIIMVNGVEGLETSYITMLSITPT